jgi:phosphatidyl-myo-inositol dimannoside synthase
VLLPHPIMVKRVNELAADVRRRARRARPGVPLGLIGPSLRLPYDVVLHGAEVTVPGRLPGQQAALAHVLRNARHVIAAGGYPSPRPIGPPDARCRPPSCRRASTPTGSGRSADERARTRADFGLPVDGQSSSASPGSCRARGSTPRSGPSPGCVPPTQTWCSPIAGGGRDEDRLRSLAAELDAPVRFLGRVAHDDLPRVYGCADVFTMLCRNRWGGLEQEGFGIVFVEAAACGVPQVAGDSGGAAEAVADGETGIVIRHPDRDESAVDDTVTALTRLLADSELRRRMGRASRVRAESEFSYDVLAARLGAALGVQRP